MNGGAVGCTGRSPKKDKKQPCPLGKIREKSPPLVVDTDFEGLPFTKLLLYIQPMTAEGA